MDLDPHGITVNAILPGPYETAMMAAKHPDILAKKRFPDRVCMG